MTQEAHYSHLMPLNLKVTAYVCTTIGNYLLAGLWQHFFAFFPLPHGQGSFGFTFVAFSPIAPGSCSFTCPTGLSDCSWIHGSVLSLSGVVMHTKLVCSSWPHWAHWPAGTAPLSVHCSAFRGIPTWPQFLPPPTITRPVVMQLDCDSHH